MLEISILQSISCVKIINIIHSLLNVTTVLYMARNKFTIFYFASGNITTRKSLKPIHIYKADTYIFIYPAFISIWSQL